MVGYKKNNTEFETVVENNYCTHNPLINSLYCLKNLR
jgi:hypothetical protein